MVAIGLQVLSQRSVALFGHLLPLVIVAAGFALWWKVIDNPTPGQLIGLGIYAVFGLAMILIRRQ